MCITCLYESYEITSFKERKKNSVGYESYKKFMIFYLLYKNCVGDIEIYILYAFSFVQKCIMFLACKIESIVNKK